jgi:mycothiol synthase
MRSYSFQSDLDLHAVRSLIKRLRESTLVDFEENLLLASVRATTRLWWSDERLVGFAYVDDYNNLRFETDLGFPSARLADEIVTWGVGCMQARNAASGREDSLDTSCDAGQVRRIALLEQHGFVRQSVRSLQYARSLVEPVEEFLFPPGFTLRSVTGEGEVEALVALHRAAFGTQNMTVEQRLSIMHAPHYKPTLDLLAVAPTGDLAAFCICGFEEGRPQNGYTDPIGTHPRYQRLGLGKAMVTAGLRALMQRGARVATLGTSSENVAMQRLAEGLGFGVVGERVWFARMVE